MKTAHKRGKILRRHVAHAAGHMARKRNSEMRDVDLAAAQFGAAFRDRDALVDISAFAKPEMGLCAHGERIVSVVVSARVWRYLNSFPETTVGFFTLARRSSDLLWLASHVVRKLNYAGAASGTFSMFLPTGVKPNEPEVNLRLDVTRHDDLRKALVVSLVDE